MLSVCVRIVVVEETTSACFEWCGPCAPNASWEVGGCVRFWKWALSHVFAKTKTFALPIT